MLTVSSDSRFSFIEPPEPRWTPCPPLPPTPSWRACAAASRNSAAASPTPSTRPRPATLSTPVRRRFATSSPTSAATPTKPPCNSRLMPRKRLFPPPKAPDGRRLANKGREPHTVLTVNDRLILERTRWYTPAAGGLTPADSWLDVAEATASVAARDLACRLNQGARSFAKATDNLARAAQIGMSAARLRQVV